MAVWRYLELRRRRNLRPQRDYPNLVLWGLLCGGWGVCLAGCHPAPAPSPAGSPLAATADVYGPSGANPPLGVAGVVVHLNSGDVEEHDRVLKSLANLIVALREPPPQPPVELVCHGDAIPLLVSRTSHAVPTLELLQRHGATLVVCGNTLRDRGLAEGDLLAGVRVVPSAVAYLVARQRQGYAYLKP